MLHTPYQNSLVWFEGVVESRMDPLELGRVQVRVFGIHTENLSRIPTKDLHWMQVMHPTTSAANSGVSETPNLLEGTHVVGYFRDGDTRQDGIVLGSIAGIPQQAPTASKGFNDTRKNLSASIVPGKPSSVSYQKGSGVTVTEGTRKAYPKNLDEPDISRLARNNNADIDTVLAAKKNSQNIEKNIPVAGGGNFSEPLPPYKAKYPYNNVRESESGHVLEFDDTPQNERVHLAHRTGSFIEMHADGTVVNKAAEDSYEITHKDSYEHVNGEKNITIDKGAKVLVNAVGSSEGLILEVGENGNLQINIKSGDLIVNVTGNMVTNVSGDMTTNVGGDYSVSAESINLN